MKSTCFISGANLFLSAGRYRGQKQVGVAPGYGCRNRNRARKKRYHEPCRRPHPPLTLRFGARNSNFPALKRGAGRTIGLAQNGTVEWYRFLRARWLSTFAFTGGCCVFGNETPTFSCPLLRGRLRAHTKTPIPVQRNANHTAGPRSRWRVL